MAATFEVEIGNQSATANSYESVAGADAYHDNHGAPASWSAAATSAKEAALRQATQFIDVVYRDRFSGYKASEAQALQWPRNGAEQNGYSLGSTVIPQALKDAVSVLAIKVVLGDTLLGDVAASDASVTSESVTVGPISRSKSYGTGGKGTQKRYTLVDAMLGSLMAYSGGASQGWIERG